MNLIDYDHNNIRSLIDRSEGNKADISINHSVIIGHQSVTQSPHESGGYETYIETSKDGISGVPKNVPLSYKKFPKSVCFVELYLNQEVFWGKRIFNYGTKERFLGHPICLSNNFVYVVLLF